MEYVPGSLYSYNVDLPVVHILFKNLNEFLPSSLLGSEDLPDGSSVVYSTQIGDKNSTKQQSDALEENPLSLKFTFDEVTEYFHFITSLNCPVFPTDYECIQIHMLFLAVLRTVSYNVVITRYYGPACMC